MADSRLDTLPTGHDGGALSAPTVRAGPDTGRRVGPYRLHEELGRGGMGVVYRAVHEELGRACALKLIGGATPKAILERFHREARTLARLGKHSNIVTCFDVGEDGERVYLAMELVEGRDLASSLEQRGPLPEAEALELVRRVAIALSHAHGKGVIHRDIKPSNILLDPNGEPLLTDFGLALDHDSSQITAQGDVLGTPEFMAPEQAQGRRDEIGPRTDIYALGVTLFHLLIGRPPFEGSALGIIANVILDDPPKVRSLRPDLSPAVEAIVCKATEKSPQRRYPTALALADDIGRVLAGAPPVARRPGVLYDARRVARRHRTALAVGVGVLGVAVLVAAGFALRAYRIEAARRAAIVRSLEGRASDDHDVQVGALEDALALDPGSGAFRVELAEALMSRATRNYRREDWDGYRRDLLRGIEVCRSPAGMPTSAAALKIRATLAEWLGETALAAQSFREAATIDHDPGAALVSTADAAFLEGRFDEGLAALAKAPDASREQPTALYRAALLKLAKEDVDGALKDIDRAIELSPTDDWFLAVRARARLQKGHLRAAARDGLDALRLFRGSPIALDILAAVAIHEGDHERAQPLAAEAARRMRLSHAPPYLRMEADGPLLRGIGPSPATRRVAEAELRLAQGDFEAAVAEASAALGLSPAHIEAFRVRARAFRALGATTDAEDDERWVSLLEPPAGPR